MAVGFILGSRFFTTSLCQQRSSPLSSAHLRYVYKTMLFIVFFQEKTIKIYAFGPEGLSGPAPPDYVRSLGKERDKTEAINWSKDVKNLAKLLEGNNLDWRKPLTVFLFLASFYFLHLIEEMNTLLLSRWKENTPNNVWNFYNSALLLMVFIRAVFFHLVLLSVFTHRIWLSRRP